MPGDVSSSDCRYSESYWDELGDSGVRYLGVKASTERKARETSEHLMFSSSRQNDLQQNSKAKGTRK